MLYLIVFDDPRDACRKSWGRSREMYRGYLRAYSASRTVRRAKGELSQGCNSARGLNMLSALSSPWIPATLLLLVACGARFLSDSWLAPGAFAALLWSVFVWL